MTANVVDIPTCPSCGASLDFYMSETEWRRGVITTPGNDGMMRHAPTVTCGKKGVTCAACRTLVCRMKELPVAIEKGPTNA